MPPAPGELADLARPWVEAPATAVVLTDFDGTLAPIVDDPATAAALPDAMERLAALAARVRTVAVVSGRPAAFLAERLAAVADRLVLVGLYGLERVDHGSVVTDPGAERWRPAVRAVVASASADAPPGIRVEDKGLTVTLHARGVPGGMAWVEATAADAAGRLGLATHPGKLSVELRPPVGGDKGTVVAEVAAGAGAACYLGDDAGDLPAFAALARLRSAGAATLAVAAAGEGAPPELLAAADLVVEGPPGALEVLAALAGT